MSQTVSTFYNNYTTYSNQIGSLLCVGLDPDPARLPQGYQQGDIIEAIREFLNDVVQATQPYAAAYKPNLAFFECLGGAGIDLLRDVVLQIKRIAPQALIILDAKRGDIGNTASFYARSVFEDLQGDAVTLSPYMGLDSLDPFLEYADRGVIVLCHTSNPGANWLQSYGPQGGPPLYLKLAADLQAHGASRQIGLVVGATRDASAIARIRSVAPDLLFLVPGIGAQGGDLDAVLDQAGPQTIINVGRAILYAAEQRALVPQLVAEAARSYAHQTRRIL